MSEPERSASGHVRSDPESFTSLHSDPAVQVRTIPVGILGRMRHVLTSDEAIWWWWVNPMYKLRDRSPREVVEAGGYYEVEAVVKDYLDRNNEAFS